MRPFVMNGLELAISLQLNTGEFFCNGCVKQKEIDLLKSRLQVAVEGLEKAVVENERRADIIKMLQEMMRDCDDLKKIKNIWMIDFCRGLTVAEIEYGKSLEPYAREILEKIKSAGDKKL